MSRISDSDPEHWHATRDDGQVRHNMPDPRKTGSAAAHWSDDERAYATHLTIHEEQAANVMPLDTDHPLVRDVLQYCANEATVIEHVRELTLILRRELAEGTPLTDAQSMKALEQMLPRLFRSGQANSATITSARSAT